MLSELKTKEEDKADMSMRNELYKEVIMPNILLSNKRLQPVNSGPHQFLMCMAFWLQTQIIFLQ